MLSNPVTRLRIIGLVEAVSFLVLLLVAMPLKYLAGLPQVVKVVGMGHGLLFVAYVLALLDAAIDRRWPVGRALRLFVASVVPAGTFFVDGWLRQQEAVVASARS